MATSDDKGRFAARTSASAMGLARGEYKVAVIAFVKPLEDDPAKKFDENLAVPKKFADLKTTPLRVRIEAGGARDLALDVDE